jgi:EAL domain-containing protein (putative c-di-GMP-specific phosphodiesterase class I)
MDGPRPSAPQAPRSDTLSSSALGWILPMARQRLRMDLALLGTFNRAGEMVCIADGDAEGLGIKGGSGIDDSIWRALAEGRGSGVVHDVRTLPWGEELLPGSGVRSLVAVPVVLPDGRPFGILSCLSRRPRPDLGSGDLRLLRVLGVAISDVLEDRTHASEVRLLQIERVLGAIGGGIRMVFQPIVELESGASVGFEALARFPVDPRRPPQSWFAGARQVGLGIDLEVAAVRAALAEGEALPPGFVSVNISPETLVSEELADALEETRAERLLLELVEHERINDLAGLSEAVDRFRVLGVRFAIDDAGAGFASLRHLLRIKPEILKLDPSLTDRIDDDPMQNLLATALASFAVEAGVAPAAEGIERASQLDALRELGIRYGQGRYLGAPRPADWLASEP